MKRIILLTLIALLVGVGIATAGEQLDLTVPITHSAYKVIGLNLDWEGATVTIFLKCVSTGQQLTFNRSGLVATNLMLGLNKADLSVKSLHKRILEYLVSEGELTGSVSGSPD